MLAAAVWVGGMIFLAIVLIPSLRNHPEKAVLIQLVGLKFRTVGWIILILLFLTGLLNMYFRQMEFTWDGLTRTGFGRMVFYKLLIFFLTIVISAIHDFYIGIRATRLWIDKRDEKKIEQFRFWARWAGRLNLLLALLAFGIGIALVRGF
jgi:copper resistance protein D